MVKTLPANAGDEILGFDPWLGKIPWGRGHMVTHSSILAWRIPWTEEPGRLQSVELQSDMTEVTQHSTHGTMSLSFPIYQTHLRDLLGK